MNEYICNIPSLYENYRIMSFGAYYDVVIKMWDLIKLTATICRKSDLDPVHDIEHINIKKAMKINSYNSCLLISGVQAILKGEQVPIYTYFLSLLKVREP